MIHQQKTEQETKRLQFLVIQTKVKNILKTLDIKVTESKEQLEKLHNCFEILFPSEFVNIFTSTANVTYQNVTMHHQSNNTNNKSLLLSSCSSSYFPPKNKSSKISKLLHRSNEQAKEPLVTSEQSMMMTGMRDQYTIYCIDIYICIYITLFVYRLYAHIDNIN